jgi:hypothetical protein
MKPILLNFSKGKGGEFCCWKWAMTGNDDDVFSGQAAIA